MVSLLSIANITEFQSTLVVKQSLTIEPAWLALEKKLKRAFDFCAAVFLLIALSPLLLLVAAAIKLTDNGPILYKSNRVGLNQSMFGMWKFRTMIVNADKQRDVLRKQAGQNKALFKLKNDPRITPLGHFLRKTSIDELPQLLNVITGEMSLVGPRALPTDDYKLFDQSFQELRASVLPGITGIWQVSGRSSLSLNQLVSLEQGYIKAWRFKQDLFILLATIPTVLFAKGAM